MTHPFPTLRSLADIGDPPSRIYLNFTEVEGDHWGWKGATFG